MDYARRARQLFVISAILYVMFALLWAVGPVIERPARMNLAAVTNLISYLAGTFAWSLMYSAYKTRGKASTENTPPAK